MDVVARFTALAGLLIGALCTPTFGGGHTIWIVDEAAGPGSHFTTIQAALDVVIDGDVVLIRSGTYDAFEARGEGVGIVADTGAEVRVVGRSRIVDVPGGYTVEVSGLSFYDDSVGGPRPLTVEGCATPVWIQDCKLLAAGSLFDPPAALAVLDCNLVTVVDCRLEGEDGSPVLPLHFLPGRGLLVEDSDVAVVRSRVLGGAGSAGSGLDGANAVEVSGGELYVDASILRGGAGGTSPSPSIGGPACSGGAGGAGLRLVTGTPEVIVRASTIVPGPGGLALDPACSDGSAGEAVLAGSGSVGTLLGTARGHDLPSVVREGEEVTIVFEGAPLEFVWWYVDEDHTQSFPTGESEFGIFFFLPGMLFAGPGSKMIPMGVTDPSGVLTLSAVVPALGPPFAPAHFAAQGLHYGLLTGEWSMTNGRVVTVLAADTP